MLALLTALWLVLAEVPTARPHVELQGVDRVVHLELGPVGAAPRVRYLPADVGLQLDVQVDRARAQAALEALPEPLTWTLEPGPGGLRIRILHPHESLRARQQLRRGVLTVELGARSEDSRLRLLAAHVQRPLPLPHDLGPHLELWMDAERAMAEGDLGLAKRLYEKLGATSHLDDLAELRVAELYLVSGHVNEALARLRQVSRRHPRTTGASLARLDVLHVETVTGVEKASLEQLELAAETVDRRRFEGYAWLRAAIVMDETEEPLLAAAKMPALERLPEAWREPAARLREDMLERAVAVPVLRGDPLTTAIGWDAWHAELEAHPRKAEIIDTVTEAYALLGLHERGVPMLRQRLRELPEALDEGTLVVRLAWAYHGLADVSRLDEVIRFALVHHPDAPDLPALVRSLALDTYRASDLARASDTLGALQALAPRVESKRMIAATRADLALAYGDAPAQAQALLALADLGFDDVRRREPALGLALARSGRPGDAMPILRKWVGRTTDPEARDDLAYHLAKSELALGNTTDAQKILELLAKSGTRYGLIARLYLRNQNLDALLDGLERRDPTKGV